MGAPQFYMKDGDVGGAVYVYTNQAGRWEGITPIRLNGSKDSMFGLAVENIGDVNQDSYEGESTVTAPLQSGSEALVTELDPLAQTDVAAGAPNEDGGSGKVYIYHGSAQGIQTRPAQVDLSFTSSL